VRPPRSPNIIGDSPFGFRPIVVVGRFVIFFLHHGFAGLFFNFLSICVVGRVLGLFARENRFVANKNAPARAV
jgi:hypothetical protein